MITNYKMDWKIKDKVRYRSCRKNCLVGNSKDSEKGSRDVKDRFPDSPWSLVITRLAGLQTAITTARADAEAMTRIIIKIKRMFV